MDALIQDPFISGIFLFVGFAIMLLEVFIPSGGILGIIAGASTLLASTAFSTKGTRWSPSW